MIMVIVATICYEMFVYIYRSVILSSNLELILFFKILTVEVIYNTLITIIIYPIMQKLGYKIEGIFKNPQILTRYF